MKMEMEDDGAVGGTGGTWTEEDRALGAAVLGTDAFAYLTKGGGAISEGLVAASLPDDLQNKLQELVESDGPGTGWNYAIFWQLSRTKSGDLVLGWGMAPAVSPEMERWELLLLQAVMIPSSGCASVCCRGYTWHSGLRMRRIMPLVLIR